VKSSEDEKSFSLSNKSDEENGEFDEIDYYLQMNFTKNSNKKKKGKNYLEEKIALDR
jgi:hypothetical protein